MSQSLRERIEGLRPVVSWGTPPHDLIDKADVLRIIAEHEREQAAVAMGVQLVRVPSAPMMPLDPDDLEADEDEDEAKCNGCGGVVRLKPDGTGACQKCNPNDKPAQCHAGTDGDCYWPKCPQLKDGEPRKSGRSCPLWNPSEDS